MCFTSKISWYNWPDLQKAVRRNGVKWKIQVENTQGSQRSCEKLTVRALKFLFPGPLLRRRFLITALFPGLLHEPAAGMGRGTELTHALAILESPSHPSLTH